MLGCSVLRPPLCLQYVRISCEQNETRNMLHESSLCSRIWLIFTRPLSSASRPCTPPQRVPSDGLLPLDPTVHVWTLRSEFLTNFRRGGHNHIGDRNKITRARPTFSAQQRRTPCTRQGRTVLRRDDGGNLGVITCGKHRLCTISNGTGNVPAVCSGATHLDDNAGQG